MNFSMSLNTELCTSTPDDISLAFSLAPIGLLVSRQRIIQTYNAAFAYMFGYGKDELSGESFARIYPSNVEFEQIGNRVLGCMRETGSSNDQRIMRHQSGRLFWCQVEGRCLDQSDPFAAAVWSFSDLSAARPMTAEFTTREREIAQFLVTGKTSKDIARQLGISHRTIEAHRARLMKKLNASTPGEMIARLAGGG
jgi:PAS domain S-box-containing protein